MEIKASKAPYTINLSTNIIEIIKAAEKRSTDSSTPTKL